MPSIPKITIGITCYNAEDTIERAIKSAMNQDWENLEILIVDDCSIDSSVEKIKMIIEKDERCYLIQHGFNQGVAAARNTLIAAAKGEFIAFFDDDDESDPARVRLQCKHLMDYTKKTGQVMVSCHVGVTRVYANGYQPNFPAIGSQEKIPVGLDIVAYQLYLDRDPAVFYGSGTPCMSFMARTEVIKNLGGFDPCLRRNEDGEFSIRLGLKGGHIIGCPETLVRQTASIGHDKRPIVSLQSDLYIIEKYRSILIENRRYYYARLWAHLKYHHHAKHRLQTFLYAMSLFMIHPVLFLRRMKARAPARLLHEWRFSKRSTSVV